MIMKAPKPKLDIIRPSWLKVDKATIFLKSLSNKPPNPAMHMVKEPKNKHSPSITESLSEFLNRKRT